jgi:hypothetical protein
MEKESMAIFVENIYEMNGSVIELSRSYAILWVFWDKENNKKYSQVIKDHPDFFGAIADSLSLGFCVITYRLFQDVENVLSLPCLINYLSSIDQKLKDQLTSKIDAQRPLLKKYIIFRHKIYAHRDKSKRPWEVFGTQSKSRVKSEMKVIVNLAQEIIGALAKAAGIEEGNLNELIENLPRREEYAGINAVQVLEALDKLRLSFITKAK